jgi:hypothetical protein
MSRLAREDAGKPSTAAVWIALGTAIYVPQLVLVAQSWRGIVAMAPYWGAGLVGVLEVVAGVALLAAVCAGVAVWRAQASRKGGAA